MGDPKGGRLNWVELMLVIVFSIYTAAMISTFWTTKGHVISKGVESYKVTYYFRVIPVQYFQLVASIALGGKFEKSCMRGLKKCATLQRFVETTCKFQLRKCAAFILHFAPISCVHCEMRTVSCNEKWETFQALHSVTGVCWCSLGSLLATLHWNLMSIQSVFLVINREAKISYK